MITWPPQVRAALLCLFLRLLLMIGQGPGSSEVKGLRLARGKYLSLELDFFVDNSFHDPHQDVNHNKLAASILSELG